MTEDYHVSMIVLTFRPMPVRPRNATPRLDIGSDQPITAHNKPRFKLHLTLIAACYRSDSPVALATSSGGATNLKRENGVIMPTFEIAGPGRDGDYCVVRSDTLGDVTHYTTLPISYTTAAEAQMTADAYNADPVSAPKV